MKIDLQCPAEVWQCRLPASAEEPCRITLNNLGEKEIRSVEITLILVDVKTRRSSGCWNACTTCTGSRAGPSRR